MRSTLSIGDQEKFSAPNRAVQAVTGAVPRNAERGRLDFIFRHARQNMRDVMLDLTNLRSAESPSRRVGCSRVR